MEAVSETTNEFEVIDCPQSGSNVPAKQTRKRHTALWYILIPLREIEGSIERVGSHSSQPVAYTITQVAAPSTNPFVFKRNINDTR